MHQHLENMSAAHAALETACADYEAACAAHEAHRDTMAPESDMEAHGLHLLEEHSDLMLALCRAVQAQGAAYAEHLRQYHAAK
jgi:hypothetical protein